ncbi:MAG: archease [Candidatus Poseidoniaceae archaeon]|jgi:SHS2 domain-containing protein|nr:archease [Candidatus Poseidoniaceae archaeon]
MSAWTRPTTADIGLRVFSSSLENLFCETTSGMQQLLMTKESKLSLNSIIRHSSQWNVRLEKNGSADYEILLIKWLEEVLYRNEVHDEFLCELKIMIVDDEKYLNCNAQVDWIDSKLLEKGVEIKAVTSHELIIEQLKGNQELISKWEEVPTFVGPGWYCDIVFDI